MLNISPFGPKIGIVKLNAASIAVYFPRKGCTEKKTSAKELWFIIIINGPPFLGILFFILIQAPNNNNCILVKNGSVGYKNWCPNNIENKTT